MNHEQLWWASQVVAWVLVAWLIHCARGRLAIRRWRLERDAMDRREREEWILSTPVEAIAFHFEHWGADSDPPGPAQRLFELDAVGLATEDDQERMRAIAEQARLSQGVPL